MKGYKTLCGTEGHTYVYTGTGGRSKGCVVCGGHRWPWSRERVASAAAGARLAELYGRLDSEAEEA